MGLLTFVSNRLSITLQARRFAVASLVDKESRSQSRHQAPTTGEEDSRIVDCGLNEDRGCYTGYLVHLACIEVICPRKDLCYLTVRSDVLYVRYPWRARDTCRCL